MKKLNDYINEALGTLPKEFMNIWKGKSANIDIEYMYSLFTHIDGKAYIVFRVSETEKFITLLESRGLTPCTNEELDIH